MLVFEIGDLEAEAVRKINLRLVPRSAGEVRLHTTVGFSVAADTGSPVNDYPAGNQFKGLLEDVRIYWGELSEGVLRGWAD